MKREQKDKGSFKSGGGKIVFMKIKLNCLYQMRNILSLWVKSLKLIYRKVLFKYKTSFCDSLYSSTKLTKQPSIRYKVSEVSFTNLRICETALTLKTIIVPNIKKKKKTHSGNAFPSLENFLRVFYHIRQVCDTPHTTWNYGNNFEVQDAKLNIRKYKTGLKRFTKG